MAKLNRNLACAIFAVAFLLLPSGLRADSLLYDNGANDPASSQAFFDSINNVSKESDAFTLSSSAIADQVVFAENGLGSSAPKSVDWCIGTTALGGQVACGSAALTSTSAGGFSYESAFSLPNLSLAGGTQYWLTLGNAVNQDGTNLDYWGVTNASSGNTQEVQTAFGVTQFFTNNNETSFQIYGTTSTTPPPQAPEPASAMLLCIGVIPLLSAIRWRRIRNNYS